jgi:hypothetical protein
MEETVGTHVYNATNTYPPVNGTAELLYVGTASVGDEKDLPASAKVRTNT